MLFKIYRYWYTDGSGPANASSFLSGEPVNVIDLAKNHPVIEVADAGEGHNDRIIETHDFCHFNFHLGNLLI